MKRILAVGGLVAVATLTSVTPAFALVDELRETTKQVPVKTTNAVESTVDDAKSKVMNTVESTASTASDITDRKQQLEDRKAALRERLDQKAVDRKTKLEGRRLAQCQNRQDKINALLIKGAENGRQHLGNIQAFEARILEFAKTKAVTGEAIDAAVADVDAKESLAIVALEAMETDRFECEALDGDKPASGVKTIREAKQETLRAYRDSVIQLIRTVKAEFAATQAEPATTEEQ